MSWTSSLDLGPLAFTVDRINLTSTNGPGTAPKTITSGPRKTTTKKTATFEFTSDQKGSTFECQVDSRKLDKN